MTISLSNFKEIGFDEVEISAFLAKHGINLGTVVEETTVSSWIHDYQLIAAFDKSDAALIMSGINPEEVEGDWNYWDNPHTEVKRKLKIIDSHAGDLLEMAGLREPARFDEKVTLEFGVQISQKVWREWCHDLGLEWPIPSKESLSSSLPRTDVDVGLLDKLRKSEAERGRLESQLAAFKTTEDDKEELMVQFSKMTDTIAVLERKNAALQEKFNKLNSEVLSGKTKTIAFKLIGCMAIDAYRVDIHSERMSNISEVKNAVELMGENISEDFIRNILRQSAKIVEKKK